MNANPIRRRRSDRNIYQKPPSLIPLLNGKRVRRSSNPLPGTVYVTTIEYASLKEKASSNSQLERVKTTPPIREKRQGAIKKSAFSTPSQLSAEPEKPTSSPTRPHPIEEQHTKIEAFAQKVSEQTAQQFIQSMIPNSLLASLSDEQLKFQEQELSANLAEGLTSKLYWALNQAWLDA